MKRILSIALSLFMLMSVCVVGASAAELPADTNSMLVPRASFYLTGHSASARAGSGSRTMVISYNVSSSVSATSIGVEKIVIYRSNGSEVATIWGTSGNGLIRLASGVHAGNYTYTGTSGQSYYAEVTVFAKNSSGSDSRVLTTGTVTVR